MVQESAATTGSVVLDASVQAVAEAALEHMQQLPQPLLDSVQQEQEEQHDDDDMGDTSVQDAAAIIDNNYTKPPHPLPLGWVVKESRSNPDYYYYYNMETGISSWTAPHQQEQVQDEFEQDAMLDGQQQQEMIQQQLLQQHFTREEEVQPVGKQEDEIPSNKRPAALTDDSISSRKRSKTSSSSSSVPNQVRILHILKKHKDSRRPESWRMPNGITLTKEQAAAELQDLLSVLQDAAHDPAELRATFEELARTESDCSSSRRGGDLGWFGPKKMQPAFEKASFALQVGEMTQDLVETSSGVHVLLRIG